MVRLYPLIAAVLPENEVASSGSAANSHETQKDWIYFNHWENILFFCPGSTIDDVVIGAAVLSTFILTVARGSGSSLRETRNSSASARG